MKLFIVFAAMVTVSLAQTTQFTGFVWPTTTPGTTTTTTTAKHGKTTKAKPTTPSVGDKCKKCMATICSASAVTCKQPDFCKQENYCSTIAKPTWKKDDVHAAVSNIDDEIKQWFQWKLNACVFDFGFPHHGSKGGKSNGDSHGKSDNKSKGKDGPKNGGPKDSKKVGDKGKKN